MDREYVARRQALLETAAIQQKTLADQFAADETAALAKIDAAALKLFEDLGPGFEAATEKLRLGGVAEEARGQFQTINAAFQQGRISANDAAEAVRRVTENLLAQGLILDDIARVVPITLQNMSGLFRGMSTGSRARPDKLAGCNRRWISSPRNPSRSSRMAGGMPCGPPRRIGFKWWRSLGIGR